MSNWQIDRDGTKRWLNSNGMHHRLDGPAVIRANGTKFWFINGLRHREDGPAVEWAYGGHKEWYVNGLRISSKDINEWIEENNLFVPFDEPTQMLFLMKFS